VQLAANSPLTRFFTSAEKLTDPRKATWQKALNLESGVRVTDVDVDKQRAVETRAALEGIMRGRPTLSQFTNFCVKPEDMAKLNPEKIEMRRKYPRASGPGQGVRQAEAGDDRGFWR
jgi:hypothetical protein